MCTANDFLFGTTAVGPFGCRSGRLYSLSPSYFSPAMVSSRCHTSAIENRRLVISLKDFFLEGHRATIGCVYSAWRLLCASVDFIEGRKSYKTRHVSLFPRARCGFYYYYCCCCCYFFFFFFIQSSAYSRPRELCFRTFSTGYSGRIHHSGARQGSCNGCRVRGKRTGLPAQ